MSVISSIEYLNRIFKILIVFFLLVIPSKLTTASELDSLRSLLQKSALNINQEIEIKYQLSIYYLDRDLDSSLFYTNEVKEIAKQINDDKYLAKAYHLLGDIELYKSNFDSAQVYFVKCLEIFHGKDFEIEFSNTMVRLGSIAFSKGNYIDALKYSQQGLKVVEDAGDKVKAAVFYSNLGAIHSSLNNDKKALDYIFKAVEIHKESSNFCAEIMALSTIGLIYSDKGDFESAQRYLQKGLESIKKCTRISIKIQFYVDLGRFDLKINNYNDAIIHLQQALGFANSMPKSEIVPESVYLAYIFEELGNAHYLLANYQDAIDYYYQGLKYANNKMNSEAYSNISKGLAKVYEAYNQSDSALYYYKIFKESSDILLNEENVRETTQIELKFEYEKELEKQQFEFVLEEEIQKKKSYIRILASTGVSVIIILILLILFLSHRNRLKKSILKRKQAEEVQKNLEKDLEFKDKELLTNAMYLLRKSEFMQSIASNLKDELKKFSQRNQKYVDDIITEIYHNTSKNDWKEFETRFQLVHTEFYENLLNKVPNLSPNELKLCSFLKLNMSTKDIAALTYQSINSIEVARYRLRKKIGLASYVNIVEFLNKI